MLSIDTNILLYAQNRDCPEHDALPKSGTKRPWNVRQNYLADAIDYRFDRIEEAMVFGAA